MPAGGSLVLSEEGIHIELQLMTRRFQEGDAIMVTLSAVELGMGQTANFMHRSGIKRWYRNTSE